jgi:hypothetical protein
MEGGEHGSGRPSLGSKRAVAKRAVPTVTVEAIPPAGGEDLGCVGSGEAFSVEEFLPEAATQGFLAPFPKAARRDEERLNP